jgi:hypothetical protein
VCVVDRRKNRPHLTTTLRKAFLLLLCSNSANAFLVAQSTRPVVRNGVPVVAAATSSYSNEVDSLGNNLQVKSLLNKVAEQKLLSKVAASGLLSKAQAAGISLSSLEPLLALAAENPDILILVEASGPELLPLLPAVVDLAPAALPLLASAVGIPPVVLQAVGAGALAAAGLALVAIPDDSVLNVAIQTIVVGLAVPAAAASFAGALVLGQLTTTTK